MTTQQVGHPAAVTKDPMTPYFRSPTASLGVVTALVAIPTAFATLQTPAPSWADVCAGAGGQHVDVSACGHRSWSDGCGGDEVTEEMGVCLVWPDLLWARFRSQVGHCWPRRPAN